MLPSSAYQRSNRSAGHVRRPRTPGSLQARIIAHHSPWGSETRIRSRGGAVVLVDQPAEQIPSTNVTRTDGDRVPRFVQGWGQAERAMRALPVVVLDIDPERPIEMPPTEDERPVKALGPDRLDHALSEGIGVRCLDGRHDHPGPFRADAGLARVTATAVLVFIVLDVVGWILRLTRQNATILQIERDLDRLLAASDIEKTDVLRLVSEYDCEIVNSVPVPLGFFQRRHDDIRELWEHRNTGAGPR